MASPTPATPVTGPLLGEVRDLLVGVYVYREKDPCHFGSEEFIAAVVSGCAGGTSSPKWCARSRSIALRKAGRASAAGNFLTVPSG
jgi:hypothetical protein